jgi:hypothetical protein
MRDEIASSVQLGLVLPRATRAASVFTAVNIRLEEAAADRRSRSQQVLRYRLRAPSTSRGGGAPAGSAGCRANRPRGGAPDTPSRRSPWRSSRLRRPCSLSGDEPSRCQLKAFRKVSGFSRYSTKGGGRHCRARAHSGAAGVGFGNRYEYDKLACARRTIVARSDYPLRVCGPEDLASKNSNTAGRT